MPDKQLCPVNFVQTIKRKGRGKDEFIRSTTNNKVSTKPSLYRKDGRQREREKGRSFTVSRRRRRRRSLPSGTVLRKVTARGLGWRKQRARHITAGRSGHNGRREIAPWRRTSGDVGEGRGEGARGDPPGKQERGCRDRNRRARSCSGLVKAQPSKTR